MARSTIYRTLAISVLAALMAAAFVRAAAAQTTIPLTADRWTATNALRFESYLGRPSLYIDRGIAIARDSQMRDGTIELDMATPKGGNFMGVVFHASSTDDSEVVYFRPAASDTPDAVQYAPALNGVGAAYMIYHGDGAQAAAPLAFGPWLHVKIELAGPVATLYLNGRPKPALTVPRLAGVDGTSVGVWTGAFGKGAYFSNIQYTARPPAANPAPSVAVPPGMLSDWELSDGFDAAQLQPGLLPDLTTLRWEKVRPEPAGFVLINRYRRSPSIDIPADRNTGDPLFNAVMDGRTPGAKVVFARTVIASDRDQFKRMLIGYNNAVVVYCNGRPLFFGTDSMRVREMADMNTIGDGIYLPLHKGANDVVLAVTNFTGGWGFWARLDP